jgi:hypothetical protein
LPYVPGNAAEGYCLECKKDTLHTVLEVSGLQVRLVRCEKCKIEGPLKMPRHKTRAGLQAALEKKAKQTGTKIRRTRKPQVDPSSTFRQLLIGKDISTAKDYNIKMHMESGDIIRHKSFGIGVVTGIVNEQKASVTFEDGSRNMVFGRN